MKQKKSLGLCLVPLIMCAVSVMSLGGLASSDPIASMRSRSSTDSIAVRALGRGNPWINLRDGHELPTVYQGAAGLESAPVGCM